MARDATDKPSPEASPIDLADVQLAVLAHNLPKFGAAALSGHIIYTLATRGRAGLHVSGMVDSTFELGLVPGYLSYLLEGYIRSKDQPNLGELVGTYRRLGVGPDNESQFQHSLAGLGVGFILAIFKRPSPPMGLVRKGIFGWADEKVSRLIDILITTFGMGAALGYLTHYGKHVVRSLEPYRQLSVEDAGKKLYQNMRLSDDHLAWLRQYATIQLWCGVKVATTSSLVAVHEMIYHKIPELRPYFFKSFSRVAVGSAAYGLLIGVPAIHGVLFDKSLLSIVKSRQEFFEGNAARAWNQHIACGALLGGSYVAVFVRRAPTSPVLTDFVRAGRFVFTPRNVLTVGGASMLFGGGLGSAVFLARSAFTSWL
ncbi:uncharacterized protein SCHCODRAFT_01180755 [Schizophyllum commune H4-8]|nr:uncharacterized protein SCHCODRAFT_01180755 [Schizophyllum commune H4-8]KAI5892070.1 hypothetical protein SCHCODRAFT_01180755 [Schizophyllum commune H4-8]